MRQEVSCIFLFVLKHFESAVVSFIIIYIKLKYLWQSICLFLKSSEFILVPFYPKSTTEKWRPCCC